jgi:uncharacterized membrane protein
MQVTGDETRVPGAETLAPRRGVVSYTGLLWAGILLGLGFGGFFDGIVFHQLLQWHHMLTSAGYPPDSVANLQINTLADGAFHAATYLFTAAGLIVLWRALPLPRGRGAGWYLLGAIIMGWGIFNLAEGIVNHHLLGIHHVRDDLPVDQRLFWDLGFLLWGIVMLLGGWWMTRRNRGPQHG